MQYCTATVAQLGSSTLAHKEGKVFGRDVDQNLRRILPAAMQWAAGWCCCGLCACAMPCCAACCAAGAIGLHKHAVPHPGYSLQCQLP
jgi:hypothetical protein